MGGRGGSIFEHGPIFGFASIYNYKLYKICKMSLFCELIRKLKNPIS